MKLDIQIQDISQMRNICGVENSNLKLIEELFDVSLEIFTQDINTSTSDLNVISSLNNFFEVLITLCVNKIQITSRDIIYIKKKQEEGKLESLYEIYKDRKAIGYLSNNKPIYPKTIKQLHYVNSLKNKDLVFSIGSAGTGKTYIAVVYAVMLLKQGKVKKLILTRPAVEAGESLGFLPGDLKEKIDPYLRPLYDALYDCLGVEQTNSLIEKNVIEIAPLAYMRGRTLESCYVILDEAQNTTDKQMKMFLTRMGFNTKMVITGDISQIDLPKGSKSGLIVATNILKDIKQIDIVKFDNEDVVRHPLVCKILQRYEKYEG